MALLMFSTDNFTKEKSMTAIISSIITGVLALVGVIISNMTSHRRVQNSLEKAQAVTDYKIEELTREVREHNNFARRMPVVEEQIKFINHKFEELERKMENE